MSPPLLATATADPAHGAPPVTGPPTLPPWPEAYVFSADPDRIMCFKFLTISVGAATVLCAIEARIFME
jgi:hypothetical protein